MARKRFVSPKFFCHGALYDAEVSSGLPLRLGYESLWCQADRRGLFAWRPRELKLHCLPYDPCDFAEVLDALERFGFIRSYVVGGKRYGFIPTLKDHQSFHSAEKADPTIPIPPLGFDHDVATAPPEHSADPVLSTTPAPPEHSADPVLNTTPAPPEHGADPVQAPPQPEACSTVAVAVAVTATGSTTTAGTVGAVATARGQPRSIDRSAHEREELELRAAGLPHEVLALDALLNDHPNQAALIRELLSLIHISEPTRPY